MNDKKKGEGKEERKKLGGKEKKKKRDGTMRPTLKK
jgi:hypothetical protein